MAQGSEFPLRKPPGFHWDFFLLGICTFIAGLVGIPAPNGLIPQAPIHTQSLVVKGRLIKSVEDEETAVNTRSATITALDGVPPLAQLPKSDVSFENLEVPIAVVEQRVSNLAQGSLCLVLLSGPFLHVLNLIPKGRSMLLLGLKHLGAYTLPQVFLQAFCVLYFWVLWSDSDLASLSWYMGVDALLGNGITHKIKYLVQERQRVPPNEPLRKVRKSRIWMFLAVQMVGFGATFAITQTIGTYIPSFLAHWVLTEDLYDVHV